MSDVGPKLRIKYKLRSPPSDVEALRWAILVEELVGQGEIPEVAGAKAAEQLFEVVDGLVLKSEADTLEALLEQAKRK